MSPKSLSTPKQVVAQQTGQPQPEHEQQIQQPSTKVDNFQQVLIDDDLLGDQESEQLAADLEPLARYNAEN